MSNEKSQLVSAVSSAGLAVTTQTMAMTETTTTTTTTMTTTAPSGDAQAVSLNDAPEVEKFMWYHGFLPRDEIVKLLEKPGDFVMRQTELRNNQGFQLVLSVRGDDRPHHFPVMRQAAAGGQFYLNKKHFFETVPKLVQHYHNGEEIDEKTRARCRTPIPRQNWELCRDQITVGNQLGKGAFGTVHRGTLEQRAFEGGETRTVPVAVKLHKVTELNKAKLAEFIAEGNMLRDYDHPNIVKFYGVSFDQQPVMLCMELADGGSLDKYLKTNAVTADDRLRMCTEAASGLAYLHARKVIHRDVAARNCLVNHGRVKISDFGLATQLAKQHRDATATTAAKETDDMKMPVRWMAPESLENHFSTASDVYSYGVLVWEIYTDAELPFNEVKSLPEVFHKVRQGRLKLRRPPGMPKDVAEIMEKCMASDPAQRPSMKLVCEELRALRTKRTLASDRLPPPSSRRADIKSGHSKSKKATKIKPRQKPKTKSTRAEKSKRETPKKSGSKNIN